MITQTMTDQLTDEERTMLVFLENYFEQHGMAGALAMLSNEGTKLEDLRVVIAGYRHFYRRKCQLAAPDNTVVRTALRRAHPATRAPSAQPQTDRRQLR